MKELKPNMGDPKISIIVPTYKRFQSVAKLIHSVTLSDIPKENWEIIFVSSDPAESDKIKWLKENLCFNISLILFSDREDGVRKKSLCFYENVGIKAAKHDWIMVINDDMWVYPDWYQEFIGYLCGSRFYLPSAMVGGRYHGFRIPYIGTYNKNGIQYPLWLADFCICHKSLYQELDYLDENINWFGYGGDWSLKVAFLSQDLPVLCHNIKIDHDTVEEARVENRGDGLNAYAKDDFEYVRLKWKNWTQNNKDGYSFKFYDEP